MKRHVDVFAVFTISLGLIALSRAPAFRLPVDSIRVENVSANMRACQVSDRIASQIAYFLAH